MEAVEEMTTILCPWRNAERDVLVCALNAFTFVYGWYSLCTVGLVV